MNTETLLIAVTLFTLATFLGVELIGRVPPTLHTPLMSGANAVSGITIVGALILTGENNGFLQNTIGFIAIVLAMMNVVGGYAVTDRMLEMFKPKESPKALPEKSQDEPGKKELR